MANVKPLRLKQQKSSAKTAKELNVPLGSVQVEVIVDTGVFHLDHPFSYLVRPEQAGEVGVGSVVKVPFRDKTLLGVVTDVGQPEKTNLAYLEKVISSNLLSPANLNLASAVAARYVSNLWDVFKLLLPPLSQGTTFSSPSLLKPEVTKRKPSRIFHEIGIAEDPVSAMCKEVLQPSNGSQLVVVPTERVLSKLVAQLNQVSDIQVIEYGGHLSPNERRKRFAKLIQADRIVVVGLRGSIFTPVRNLKRIIILNEFSEHHYEPRAPYWNTRDVALLRSEQEGCDLHFVSSTYSTEIARLINLGWIRSSSRKQPERGNRHKVSCAPESYNSIIRDSLKTGSVLISVAGKEYSSGFICEQCKNAATCKCHGRLLLQEKDLVSCAICDFSTRDWRCSHCNSQRKLIFRSGAKKIHEEIGKAFPKTDVFLSTSEKPIETIDHEKCLVVATSGMEPSTLDGYAGVAFLDGEQLLARQFIRADEELFQRWMECLVLIRKNGNVYSSLPQGNKISQVLISENKQRFYRALLSEREETRMPPFTRVVKVSAESRTLIGLRSKLEAEFGQAIEIHVSHMTTQMTVKIFHEKASEFLTALKAVQKLRSASGKDLMRVQVDPYSF